MHVSFDFWNTLYRSNPDFKEQRQRIVVSSTGALAKDVDHSFASVGKWHNDQVMLRDGIALPSRSLCSLVLGSLGSPREEHSAVTVEIEKLFLKYAPLPINSQRVEEWRSGAVTTSILSNTTFISGSVIRSFLFSEGAEFDFMLFSDELGYGKPHPKAFQEIAQNLSRLGFDAQPQRIVHVGDDPVFDSSSIENIKSVLL